MGLESSALSTMTGEVNRAYLLVRKEVVREENRKSGGIAGLTDDLNIGSTVAGMSELYDSLNSVSSQMNGINSLLGVEQNIYRVANSKGYMPIKVQYNPSSIVYAGLKGTQGIGEHDGAFIEHDRPVETTMGMELIFDSLDLNKAFMMNKTAKDIVVGSFKHNSSVQAIVELLIAATVTTSTRWIGFAWNKTLFWGELVSVSAAYTMFDVEGNPIRAKVGIRMRHDAVNVTNLVSSNNKKEMKENMTNQQKEWEKQINALKKKEAKMSSGVSNLINTNF